MDLNTNRSDVLCSVNFDMKLTSVVFLGLIMALLLVSEATPGKIPVQAIKKAGEVVVSFFYQCQIKWSFVGVFIQALERIIIKVGTYLYTG